MGCILIVMTPKTILTEASRRRRGDWIDRIRRVSGQFGDDASLIEKDLKDEVAKEGLPALVDHLRLCGSIPETFGYSSTEEKLYSKYTDCVLSECFRAFGMTSVVLTGRGDAVDVEAATADWTLVADAKAFRLSRTAKNQKDFKIQALDGWRYSKRFAIVVCPIYQLPRSSSQVYRQATTRNVCILSYSHLAVVVAASTSTANPSKALVLLYDLLVTVEAMNPESGATAYWGPLNQQFVQNGVAAAHWAAEKRAAQESLDLAKAEAAHAFSLERDVILRMSQAEAVQALLKGSRVQEKIRKVKALSLGPLMDLK